MDAKRLSEFVNDSGFNMTNVNIFLLTKEHLLVIQMHVDDIPFFFGATKESIFEDFSNLMKEEFEISMNLPSLLNFKSSNQTRYLHKPI